jgi:TonB family protein
MLQALLCAGAVAANGAGAAGQVVVRQEKPQQEKAPAEKRAADVLVQHDRILIDSHTAPPGAVVFAAQGPSVDFSFVASEMAFDHQIVRGAPFSADAVTESVQTLGDGNRITRKTTARLARDSEGRTRREQALNGIGPWASGEDAPQTVFINDPVAGVNYILNTRERTGTKLTPFVFRRTEKAPGDSRQGDMWVAAPRPESKAAEINGGNIGGKAINKVQPVYPPIAKAAGAEGTVRVEVTVDEQGNVASANALDGHPLLRQAAVDAARQWAFSPTKLQGQPVKIRGFITFNFALDKQERPAGLAPAGVPAEPGQRVIVRERAPGAVPFEHFAQKFPESKESLGAQTIEGVQAEGTRTTVTIPAGAIGNERPVQIVSERWYSPELKTVVMTRHSDPRFGETTYRLTNLSRAEPDRSLFEAPADFQIKEGGPGGGMQTRIIMKER